ncbi:MAG: hypothetical protein HOJ34_11845 [Kordiimonadaceae bacterium]|jgi:hypothetical protein|nr:hypothetical protein [Kordiimonadaceae bacterium]MBT6036687.1 hypothetical protein [Kordiimonadaceae bacterium]MBT6330462.1 hypothetical protein [Kordiimonadaceae bacterium]MBT7583255.1 hypothetical protein [Kordiimonadaceae bacterium]
MKNIILLILLSTLPLNSSFSQQPVTPCNSEDHDDIDFWVGKWDATWQGGSGTNEITKEYNGCVIRENFKGSNLLGMSVSSYSKADKTWRQIWLDEQNGFLDLKGFYDGDNYIFHTTPNPDTPNSQLQMVFTDIQKDSFTWTWMATNDGGKNWQNNWQISYTRAK